MTAFLLDTNVISELSRRRPDPSVVEWLRAADECRLSVLTIGELQRGVRLLRRRDPGAIGQERADRIDAWLAQLCTAYADRILDVDLRVMRHWADLPTRRTLPAVDGLIAATAAAHGLTIATRNARDFEGLGVAVVNPFAESAR